MRAVVERVSTASVTIDGRIVGEIERGLLVYVGVAKDDGPDDLKYLAEKIAGLRIFNDADGKMNMSVADVKGGILAISAFAVQGDVRRGRRPSFDQAAGPELAASLYDQLCDALAAAGLTVAHGIFRAHMHVACVNDGPICVLLDSKRTF